MKIALLITALTAGCGSVAPPEELGTSVQVDEIVPACRDLTCDFVECVICYACPGKPSGELTCYCGWQGVVASRYTVCVSDNPDDPL